MAMITFVVAEIIMKEAVMPSLMTKITSVVDEITFKVVVITFQRHRSLL